MTFRRLPRLEPAHHVEVRRIFIEESEKLEAKKSNDSDVFTQRVQAQAEQEANQVKP